MEMNCNLREYINGIWLDFACGSEKRIGSGKDMERGVNNSNFECRCFG